MTQTRSRTYIKQEFALHTKKWLYQSRYKELQQEAWLYRHAIDVQDNKSPAYNMGAFASARDWHELLATDDLSACLYLVELQIAIHEHVILRILRQSHPFYEEVLDYLFGLTEDDEEDIILHCEYEKHL